MQTLQSVSPHGKKSRKNGNDVKSLPFETQSSELIRSVTEIGLPGSNDKEMIGTITPGLWRDSFTSKKKRKLDNSLGQPST